MIDIPFIGVASTGDLIAALAIILLIYIWLFKPKFLKKKTREYLSIFLVIVIAGLYLTNSLVIIGGQEYTVKQGSTFMFTPKTFSNSYASGYDVVLSEEILWIDTATWPKVQNLIITASEGVSDTTACGANFVCSANAAVNLAALKSSATFYQLIYKNQQKSVLQNVVRYGVNPPWPKLTDGTTKMYLVEFTRFGKSCTQSGTTMSCQKILVISSSNLVTITAGTPPSSLTYECGIINGKNMGTCDSNQICQIATNGETKCVAKDEPTTKTVNVAEGGWCGYTTSGSLTTIYQCNSGLKCTNSKCVSTAPVEKCGDTICQSSESCSSCPSDCGSCAVKTTYYCYSYNEPTGEHGDSCISSTSTSPGNVCFTSLANCQQSLNSLTPTQSVYCGNGLCDGSDTCSTCPSDCGTCPSPGTSQDTCESLGGQVYNPKSYDCSEELMWVGTAGNGDDLLCCSTTPTKKQQMNWDLIIIIFVALIAVLVILSIVNSFKKKPKYTNLDRYSDLISPGMQI